MRLGLSSPLQHTDAKEWAQRLENLGCKSVNFPIPYNAPENTIADYVDAAREHDLLIAEVGIWKNVFATDFKEREEARTFAVGQLRMADEIGAKCCVNTAGTYGGPIWDGGYPENLTKECWGLTVGYIQQLIDEVNPQKVKFSLEPMPWMIPTSPDECLKLLHDVDRKAFGIHLDVINMVNCPYRYFHIDDFVQECFDKLGDRVLSCHLKDVRLTQKLTFMLEETTCGKGVLNIEQYGRLINACDEEMPVIIEHLNTDEEYIESLSYVIGRMKGAGIPV